MKRVLLFLATNIAVLLVLSITLRLFGFQGFLAENGVDLALPQLLLFAAVFGMGGSFISLAMSKWIAKRATGAQVITDPRTPGEQWLVETVRQQAKAAGIGMPEVAIFPSPEPNAFATGARRDASLVAVSTGLLERMDKPEIEAVLAHEVSHVANGDMVTLALVQGVVNTFVLFLSRVIGHVVDRAVCRTEEGHGPGFWIVTIVAQLLLGILASIIVFWFSRRREFRADAGGAHLAGAPNMIAALERLKAASGAPETMPDALRAFGIRGGRRSGFLQLFASHPPLEDRIEALRRNKA
jgi:heat shock protein HtpX